MKQSPLCRSVLRFLALVVVAGCQTAPLQVPSQGFLEEERCPPLPDKAPRFPQIGKLWVEWQSPEGRQAGPVWVRLQGPGHWTLEGVHPLGGEVFRLENRPGKPFQATPRSLEIVWKQVAGAWLEQWLLSRWPCPPAARWKVQNALPVELQSTHPSQPGHWEGTWNASEVLLERWKVQTPQGILQVRWLERL